MEKNQKKNKSSIKRIMNSSFSVKCSFMLAVISMFSILFSAFSGPLKTSYAIPEKTNNPMPDTFLAKLGGNRMIGSGFTVLDYVTDGGIPVYCLEKNIDFVEDEDEDDAHSKGDQIVDYGLLYLMANSYPNVNFKDGYGNNLDPRLQVWMTQVAIWLYQKEVGAPNSDGLTDDHIGAIQTVTVVTASNDTTNTNADLTAKDANGQNQNLYATYIKPLVDAAIANKNVPNKSLSASIESSDFTLDADEKYYKSSLVTVVGGPSDNFSGYTINFDKCPEGTILVDENGNTIKDANTDVNTLYQPGTKFYIKVPVASVTEDSKKINLSFVGHYSTYEGNYYTAAGKQTITNVMTTNSTVPYGLNITLDYKVDSADTKMNVSQNMYFVGLLILLAGVGIIYANVLPKKEQ